MRNVIAIYKHTVPRGRKRCHRFSKTNFPQKLNVTFHYCLDVTALRCGYFKNSQKYLYERDCTFYPLTFGKSPFFCNLPHMSSLRGRSKLANSVQRKTPESCDKEETKLKNQLRREFWRKQETRNMNSISVQFTNQIV